MSGTASSFMMLPKEIRLKVYESLLLPIDDEPILLRWPPEGQPVDLDRLDPPLLRVNSVVRAEAHEIYYSRNTFRCSSIHSPNLRALAMLAGISVRRICVKTTTNPFMHTMSNKLDLFMSWFPRLDLLIFDVRWWATSRDLLLIVQTGLRIEQWRSLAKIELWATGRKVCNEELAFGTGEGGQTRGGRHRGFTVRFLHARRKGLDAGAVALPEDDWSVTTNVDEVLGIQAPDKRRSRMAWTRNCIQPQPTQ